MGKKHIIRIIDRNSLSELLALLGIVTGVLTFFMLEYDPIGWTANCSHGFLLIVLIIGIISGLILIYIGKSRSDILVCSNCWKVIRGKCHQYCPHCNQDLVYDGITFKFHLKVWPKFGRELRIKKAVNNRIESGNYTWWQKKEKKLNQF